MGKARMVLVMARAAPKPIVVDKRMMASAMVEGVSESSKRDGEKDTYK
jgi:hypothetical protein